MALAFGLTFTTVLFLVVTYYTRRLIRQVAQQDLVAALVSQHLDIDVADNFGNSQELSCTKFYHFFHHFFVNDYIKRHRKNVVAKKNTLLVVLLFYVIRCRAYLWSPMYAGSRARQTGRLGSAGWPYALVPCCDPHHCNPQRENRTEGERGPCGRPRPMRHRRAANGHRQGWIQRFTTCPSGDWGRGVPYHSFTGFFFQANILPFNVLQQTSLQEPMIKICAHHKIGTSPRENFLAVYEFFYSIHKTLFHLKTRKINPWLF